MRQISRSARDLDHAERGGDQDRAECRDRQDAQHAAEEDQRRRQGHRRDDGRELRPAAGGDVDRGARARGGDREPAEAARREIGGAEADQLAVRLDLGALAGAEAAGGDDAGAEGDREDRAGAEEDRSSSGSAAGRRDGEARQPGGDVADDRDAVAAEVEERRRAATASTTTTSGPGTGKRAAFTPCSTASMAKASATEGQWMLPALRASSTNGRIRPSASIWTPVKRPIWPTRIESEMPMKKPVRIGRDRKLASTPSRAPAPAGRARPTASASSAATATRSAPAAVAVTAASTAASTVIVAASGPTISFCDGPRSA